MRQAEDLKKVIILAAALTASMFALAFFAAQAQAPHGAVVGSVSSDWFNQELPAEVYGADCLLEVWIGRPASPPLPPLSQVNTATVEFRKWNGNTSTALSPVSIVITQPAADIPYKGWIKHEIDVEVPNPGGGWNLYLVLRSLGGLKTFDAVKLECPGILGGTNVLRNWSFEDEPSPRCEGFTTVNSTGQLCRQNKVASGWCTDVPNNHWKCWNWQPRTNEFDPVGPQPCEIGCVENPPLTCECVAEPGCICNCYPAPQCEPDCFVDSRDVNGEWP